MSLRNSSSTPSKSFINDDKAGSHKAFNYNHGDKSDSKISSQSSINIESNVQDTKVARLSNIFNSSIQNEPSIVNDIHEQTKSIERQYQFKLDKERQYCQIIEMKLNQEIQLLRADLTKNQEENKMLKASMKERSKEDAPMSDDFLLQNKKHDRQLISRLQRLLSDVQKEHGHCIANKKVLLDEKQSYEIKIKILLGENSAYETEIKELRKQVNDHQVSTIQLKEYEKKIESLNRANVLKQKQFTKELNELEKAIMNSIKANESKKAKPIPLKEPSDCTDCEQHKSFKPNSFSDNFQTLQIEREKSMNFDFNLFSSHMIETPVVMQENNLYHNQRSHAQNDKQIVEAMFKKNIEYLPNSQNHNPIHYSRERNLQEKYSQELSVTNAEEQKCYRSRAKKANQPKIERHPKAFVDSSKRFKYL